VPYLLALAAASFLYLATADLVPLLQRDRRGTDFATQLSVLLLGVGVVLAGRA
jgi:zinc and cadmium transporter